MYLFVVALGTDYNILVATRLREELRHGRSPREAAREAVRHTSPTIAAAGVVLAGTFATLTITGISDLVQLGFAVATGIALAAFVMSMVLVPALTSALGRRVWWPGRLPGSVGRPEPSSDAATGDGRVAHLGDPR
jgi:RND superfamily putative drug exporter